MSATGLRHTSVAKRRAEKQIRYRSEPVPGPELYGAVRAGLLMNGHTLASLCREIQVDRSYAYGCLIGKTNGNGAKRLRARLLDLAGVGGCDQ